MVDKVDMLKDELVLIDDAIAAPTRPFSKNYEKKSAAISDDSKVHGFSLKH